FRAHFFFSSRRRHTRFKCDWSSDVCSSDLSHRRRRPYAERAEPEDPASNERAPDRTTAKFSKLRRQRLNARVFVVVQRGTCRLRVLPQSISSRPLKISLFPNS